MSNDLTKFIRSNPDGREIKRAVAVQMYLNGCKHREISAHLGVSSGFISKWTDRYRKTGIAGLKLGYIGSVGYLRPKQRKAVIEWLKARNYWHLAELQAYIEQEYEVVFSSKQSYYTLFEEAGISWKKTQKRNPKGNPEEVAETRKTLTEWLEERRDKICAQKLIIWFEDECHLLWGDLCGYAWGQKQERIEVPMTNERSKQTYYGAVNLLTQECLTKKAAAGNSTETIAFLEFLRQQYPEAQIAVIWDGASYHRSEAIREYLDSVNQDCEPSDWKVTCLRFAPNDPRQNPMEDIWLQAKRFIREYYNLCKSFKIVKFLFEFATHQQMFDFPKLFTYGCFS